ncbi:hypothetical protein WJX81_000192 [Elliptochloris bilobata]|uniref:glutamine synthetase n=1 Tax=Elliptochloris bilobata TaxID=381761 RepID=A0AAW1RGQ6_9CHLO
MLANDDLARHYASLSTRGKCLAEYIFVGGNGSDLHSKSRVLDAKPKSVEELRPWHFDGSQTGQAPASSSAVYLRPRAIYPDPVRGGDHILVLCDTYTPPTVESDSGAQQMQLHPSNNRAPCERVMRAAASSAPVFSCEQQYSLLDPKTGWPVGLPEGSMAGTSNSYCASGAALASGRDFQDAHLRACMHAGVRISGGHAEAAVGQWSYCVGPCRGIELGDQLWISRFILLRMADQFRTRASFEPKPVPGDWQGNGAHVKVSTRETREAGRGWFAVQEHVRRLGAAHGQHLMAYGAGAAARLGPSALTFRAGMEDRRAAVRIPTTVLVNQCGWYEDRRPAANMDPYLVTMLLVCTTLGVPLPVARGSPSGSPTGDASHARSSGCGSGPASRSSSAILDELDELDELGSFAPDTPPQALGLLAAECSSDNFLAA